MIQDLLRNEGIRKSKNTILKYMQEMGLKSIVRRRKPAYQKGSAHKIFKNLLNRKFEATKPNQIWCTDFTYLYLSNGKTRYNCTIIDLYDRSVVATLNGNYITSQLAINTLKIAIARHKPGSGLILHSDQGSQYTSKDFTDFCSKSKISQSMSRAGCPYDNAPMERFYNSLKNEFIYLYSFKNEHVLDTCVNEWVYAWYNRVRPHTYNSGLPPSVARVA